MSRIGDGPIEARYHELMNSVAAGLDDVFNGDKRGANRTTGFVLLVFPFNATDGRCNYISNGANRKDIVTMLKEQIRRFEGQPDVKGRA